MRRIAHFLVACLLWQGLAPTVAAQATQDPDILVVGKMKKILRSFVTSMTQAGPTGQLARWKQEVCPFVLGIAPDQAEFMISRIAEVAKQVRLRRGGSGCVTTLSIIITPDSDAWAKAFVKEYPITLSHDGYDRMKDFASTSRPVRWISVTNEMDGCEFGICELPNSRLKKATKPILNAMIIVVDAGALSNVSIGELSDYVALVALSNPPLRAARSSNSVLTMFDGPRVEGPPFVLTAYDLSFLGGLYGTAIDTDARQQRATIVNRMNRDARKKQ